MELSGVHLLLTYRCILECDHCFVWGSPRQTETMSFDRVDAILDQARAMGTVKWIYFEGGEPFLFSSLLRYGVESAAASGFRVGVVTNAYWAADRRAAEATLRPFAGLIQDLSISGDLYHGDTESEVEVENALWAARQLGIPVDVITIAPPEESDATAPAGQLPPGTSRVCFRGRAAQELVDRAVRRSAERFDECPYENLVDPGRVHVDPLGHVHLCQGIAIGNLDRSSLVDICRDFAPEQDPIVGPLIEGGPLQLARLHEIDVTPGFADACHLCYETRARIRAKYPATLVPETMYGGR